jgi:hypothetical protein
VHPQVENMLALIATVLGGGILLKVFSLAGSVLRAGASLPRLLDVALVLQQNMLVLK